MPRNLLNLFIVALSVAMLFSPDAVFAGRTGGLSENIGAQMLTANAGVEYSTRDVESNGNKEEVNSRRFVVKTTYGLSDRINVFATLGFADSQDIGNHTGALGTLYGGGLKYLVFTRDDSPTKVSINANIETFKSRDSGQTAEHLEYDVAVIVSNKNGNVTPFGGIRFSDADIDFAGPMTYKADDHFGLFGGVDYFVNPNVYFTGEVHTFDENSIFLGVGYSF